MGTDQDPAIALQLKSQLGANRLEIREPFEKEEEKLKVAIEQYQKRLKSDSRARAAANGNPP